MDDIRFIIYIFFIQKLSMGFNEVISEFVGRTKISRYLVEE